MCQYCTNYYSFEPTDNNAYRYPEPYVYNEYDERQFLPPFFQGIFGPPSGPPGFGPPFGGQGPQQGPPSSPPPSFVPMQSQQVGAFAVDPGSMRRCLFRFTYVWLRGGQQFWFYPTFIGRRSVAGYRWTGFRWMFFGIDSQRISSFTCV